MVRGEIPITVEEWNNSDKNKWLEDELSRSGLKDARLRKRFKNLLEQLWNGLGQKIPFACQDWEKTKVAYRFLSNDRVKEDQILAGHFQSTKDHVHAIPDDKILVLQDTTEFSYHRDDQEAIGSTRIVSTCKDLFGKPVQHKKCGVLMHSSLAITTKGLPLGLTAIKFWTRK